jgi:hypothetical protein
MTIGNDLKTIKQELDLVWPLTNDGSVFDEKETSILESFATKDVVQTLKFCKGKFYLDFYEQINPLATYIISIDTASGFGQDGTAINVIDPIDNHIVGSLNNNRIGAVELEEIIMNLMQVWFRDAYLVIEAAPIAIPILQRLSVISNIEKRLFKQLVERQAERKLADGTIKKEKVKVWRYGVSTNTATRPQMMDLLLTIVRDTPQVITSPLVFNDIRNLENHNGKIQASNGLHDDSVMSYLITRWAIAYTPYFKGKKFRGGMLTKDILTEGTKIYHGLDLQASGFGNMLGMDSPITRTNIEDKTINNLEYAEKAQLEQKDPDKNVKRNRFSTFMNM